MTKSFSTLRENELKKLGKNIKRLRKASGMNQTWLAEKANTRPTTISSIENGTNTNPGWDLLDRISKVFSTTIHELTQPSINLEPSGKRSQLPSGLSELMQRQNELLPLGEQRISLRELEWLSAMPLAQPQKVFPEQYLLILRHYRLVMNNNI